MIWSHDAGWSVNDYPPAIFLVHSIRMVLDDRTAQEQLSPEERRGLLRAFADRMLLKITAMDDPEDMSGVERAVRVAAVIERLYSRCDRAERHAPDPRKVEAERAAHESDAIKARVALANTLEWGEKRRRDLGPWWDVAQKAAQAKPQAAAHDQPRPVTAAPDTADVTYVDYTDSILAARADLNSRTQSGAPSPLVPTPFRGPPSRSG